MKLLLLLAVISMLALTAAAQPAKLSKEAARKIADATPAALPQSPTDDRVGNDARDADLKGKVKSITYSVMVHGDKKYTRPIVTAEDFFDETGNRIRSIDWDNGRPLSVTVYGYLDRFRSSRQGHINYGDCDGSDRKKCSPLVHTMPTPKGEGPERDNRYDIRWVYKYDPSGRLAEEIHLNNAGETLTRTTYTYEGPSRRVALYFAAGLDPLARVIEIIDPVHGIVVEERLHDDEDKVNLIRSYGYKFDEHGNWIEQRVSERSTYDKRPATQGETIYRAITYYSGY